MQIGGKRNGRAPFCDMNSRRVLPPSFSQTGTGALSTPVVSVVIDSIFLKDIVSATQLLRDSCRATRCDYTKLLESVQAVVHHLQDAGKENITDITRFALLESVTELHEALEEWVQEWAVYDSLIRWPEHVLDDLDVILGTW